MLRSTYIFVIVHSQINQHISFQTLTLMTLLGHFLVSEEARIPDKFGC